MDLAPALPPSQDTRSVLVSTAVELPPGSLQDASQDSLSTSGDSFSTAGEPTIQLSFVSTVEAVPTTLSIAAPNKISTSLAPPALMVSVAGLDKLSVSSSFLSSSQLAHSFDIVGQFLRSARAASGIVQPLYSEAIPIYWETTDTWRGKALASAVEVSQVEVTPQIAQLENNYWSAVYTEQCLQGAQRTLAAGNRFKISLGDKTLGYVASEDRAYALAQQLSMMIRQAAFSPSSITPFLNNNPAFGEMGALSVGSSSQASFAIDAALAEELGYSREWAAVAWANNLRSALDEAPLSVGDAHMGLQDFQPSDMSMAGDASWYGPYFHGRATANGETYNQNDLTVAHKSLPFGTQLKVRNLTNDKTVVVRVNDRGPYVGDRILDLSKAAADCLGSDQSGVVPVEATILKSNKAPTLSAK
ncbi:MAG: septal ring lytic transglycosylase RlpA family protein [Cyanobacteria bacterium J06643_4]